MKRLLSLFLVFCLFPCAAAFAEAPLAEKRTLIPEDGSEMRYECVFFRNAWPEGILTSMTENFPDDAPICGVYYIWRNIAGTEIPIVFAAVMITITYRRIRTRFLMNPLSVGSILIRSS